MLQLSHLGSALTYQPIMLNLVKKPKTSEMLCSDRSYHGCANLPHLETADYILMSLQNAQQYLFTLVSPLSSQETSIILPASPFTFLSILPIFPSLPCLRNLTILPYRSIKLRAQHINLPIVQRRIIDSMPVRR